jgi:outer membrane protein assembly factor BamB
MTGAENGRARLPPAAALVVLVVALASVHPANARSEPMWTTYHRDAGRSGDDTEPGEAVTPTFDWQSPPLEGKTWGQPLVLGERVYVATAGDYIYALDAASGKVVWSKQAGTPVPAAELPCGDIEPTVGMIGTPVIDAAAGAIYVVADTWDETHKEAHHVLEGYRLSDGSPLLSTPVDPPGADPKTLLQRTALTLDEGDVVFGMGGNDGDCGEYLGTVVAAPESGGEPRFWQYHPKSPAYSGGAVWGPSGPVVYEGDIFVADGNPNTRKAGELVSEFDYSDSLLRLDPATDLVTEPAKEPAAPLGWFEPPKWSYDSNNDLDLGSAGPELLPGGVLFQAGKNGEGFLLEAGMTGASTALYKEQVCGGAMSFGGDAFANGIIYVACQNGVQALSYNQPAHTFASLWQDAPPDASGPPIVAAGTVWVVKGGGTKLYGLDPATGQPRYTETLPSGVSDHFASPSAAGGRLFVATGASVSAYRIAQPEPPEAGPPAPETPGPPAPGAKSPASTPPTSASPASAPPPEATSPANANAWLVRWRLHVGARGRLALPLRCPAAASCAGTIKLQAEIPRPGGGSGKHRSVQMVPVTLARVRYGPSTGSFKLVVWLGRAARAHLRLHHDRLELQVRIATSGGAVRRTTALLT